MVSMTVRIRCKLSPNESPKCFRWTQAYGDHGDRSCMARMTLSEIIKRVEDHFYPTDSLRMGTEGLLPACEGSKYVPHHLGWRLFCFVEGSTESYSDCNGGEVSRVKGKTNTRKSLSLLIARRATSAQGTNETKKQQVDAAITSRTSITCAWASDKINAETTVEEIPTLLFAANKQNHADFLAKTESSSASLCRSASLSNAACWHIAFVFVFDTSLKYVQLACDLGEPQGGIPPTVTPQQDRPTDDRESNTSENDGHSPDIDLQEIDRRLRPVPAEHREMLRIALINCFQRKARALERGESTQSADDLEKVIMITITNFAVLEVD